MDNIKIEKVDKDKSILKHTVKYHRNRRIISYDYDMYEMHKDTDIIGYILKYNILGMKNSVYIDIFITDDFRNKGYGTYSLSYFINNMVKEDTVMIISDDIYKSKFLLKCGFIKDDIFIYNNLYKYKRGVSNEQN